MDEKELEKYLADNLEIEIDLDRGIGYRMLEVKLILKDKVISKSEIDIAD